MSDMAPPKGTFDIIPFCPNAEDIWKSTYQWNHIESIIRQITTEYGYHEIRTPIFERTELFHKTTGETTDIVTKEMYTFQDKGNRSMTLRPEGTPCVMRAFLDNQLQQLASVHKFFYLAPMFRYERPQAGRYRQHHQFGVEVIGNGTPEQDVEVIDLLYSFHQRIGIQNIQLCINSLGTPDCRAQFRNALRGYLKDHFAQLSRDSQTRFENNPLRILDSKDLGDQELLKNAPLLSEFLSSDAKNHFAQVCDLLGELNISYKIEPKLVRGLDYYNHTVFEVMVENIGAQSSIGGGGRYDGMLKSMGGPDLPTVGFGTGLERLLRTLLLQGTMENTRQVPFVTIIPLGNSALKYGMRLSKELRQKGVPISIELGQRKAKAAMKIADQIGSQFVCVIGDQELEQEKLEIKNMGTGDTHPLSLIHVEKEIVNLYNAYIAKGTKNAI